MGTPLAINTNIGSLNVQRSLTFRGRLLNESIERLSSGLKINSASDDAAGIAVSENLTAQTRGFKQALENANDAVSILSTAEGSYNTISDILIRMRELAVQSANDSLGTVERGYLNTEFTQLIQEITRVSDVAEYNGIKLLDGTGGDGTGNFVFQVGTRNTANDRIGIALADVDAGSLGVAANSVDTLVNAQLAIDSVDAALTSLATDRATIGSTVNQLTAAVDNLAITIENLSAANSQIKDADLAAESADFTRNQVLMQAGTSMLAQANSIPQLALQLLQ
jgi:flagellin